MKNYLILSFILLLSACDSATDVLVPSDPVPDDFVPDKPKIFLSESFTVESSKTLTVNYQIDTMDDKGIVFKKAVWNIPTVFVIKSKKKGQAVFIAPALSEVTTFDFDLTVTDSRDQSVKAITSIYSR